MKRTITSNQKLITNIQIITDILSRAGLARRLGYAYGDKRKLYKALGYPEEQDLTFEYFYNKYDRNSIANAIINRPCDATWKGDVTITEPGKTPQESPLNKAWLALSEELSLKRRLNKVDKLCELGRYSVLILGLDDVKDKDGFKKVVSGKRKLLYVKQAAESEAIPETFEKDPKNSRYGMPVLYRIKSGTAQTTSSSTTTIEEFQDILVHYSRILHFVTGNLTSEVYGVSKLKPIVNELMNIEKILGGDAEMFWRGARPGYHASAKEDYELGDAEKEALFTELDNFEHDLRRFITTKGVDLQALEQQLADPLNHLDAQLQAISAQTGIPKRVLIGSERGELASSQDKDQWKELIQTRQHEHAEPTILRPFIDKLMAYGILPVVKDYNIMWEDIFAPSDMDKAKVGKERANALKAYADSPLASSLLPPAIAFKILLGLNEEQVQEATKAMEFQQALEDKLMAKLEADEPLREEEEVEEEEVGDV